MSALLPSSPALVAEPDSAPITANPVFPGIASHSANGALFSPWQPPCDSLFHLLATETRLVASRSQADLAETKTKSPPSRAFPSPLWSKQNPWVSSHEASLRFGVLDFAFVGRQREFSNSGEVCQWRRAGATVPAADGGPFPPRSISALRS